MILGQFTFGWLRRYRGSAKTAHARLFGIRYWMSLRGPWLWCYVHYVDSWSSLQQVSRESYRFWELLLKMCLDQLHQPAKRQSNFTRLVLTSSNAVSWWIFRFSWEKLSPRTVSKSCPLSRRMHLPNKIESPAITTPHLCCLEHNWLVFFQINKTAIINI